MEGRPHHAATISRAFQDALVRAKLPKVRFHDLRHSAATFLLAQGFTLEDVKNLLGHSSIVLTSNTYGHVLEQRQRQVAMGMDAVLGG
jgi:integrase